LIDDSEVFFEAMRIQFCSFCFSSMSALHSSLIALLEVPEGGAAGCRLNN